MYSPSLLEEVRLHWAIQKHLISRMASEGARDMEEVEDMETEMSPEREFCTTYAAASMFLLRMRCSLGHIALNGHLKSVAK